MKFILLHGYKGSPDGNWFPWLKEQLKDHDVSTPSFPSPATIDEWYNIIDTDQIDDQTILIGHSLGGSFVLRLLEKGAKPHAAIVVSAPIKRLGIEDLDDHIVSFVEPPFKWETIKQNCKNILVVASDNDPYVPMEHASTIAKNLSAHLDICYGCEHIQMKEYPELLEKMNLLLSE